MAAAAAGGALEQGPVLSAASAYQLDSEAFWCGVAGAWSAQRELTGPADPLLLRGSFSRAEHDTRALVVKLIICNRWGSRRRASCAVYEKHCLTPAAPLTQRIPSISAECVHAARHCCDG